ncbi:MAG: hypothetical protein KatS3mg083_237 [Candidatus Dojkabacteria bacterium]|nr:MAG: hypothetical protein KatS3mg083_237 [Candidatus Dojkabacteria bacterium]
MGIFLSCDNNIIAVYIIEVKISIHPNMNIFVPNKLAI